MSTFETQFLGYEQCYPGIPMDNLMLQGMEKITTLANWKRPPTLSPKSRVSFHFVEVSY